MSKNDLIREELELVKGNKALLKAEGVVEWARVNPASALYKSFQWDNEKAGQEYRLWQARQLIALHVVTEPHVRKFVSLTVDRGKPGGGYRSIDEVAANVDLRKILLRDALHEFQRVRDKHKHLTEFAKISEEIDFVAQAIEPEKKPEAA